MFGGLLLNRLVLVRFILVCLYVVLYRWFVCGAGGWFVWVDYCLVLCLLLAGGWLCGFLRGLFGVLVVCCLVLVVGGC